MGQHRWPHRWVTAVQKDYRPRLPRSSSQSAPLLSCDNRFQAGWTEPDHRWYVHDTAGCSLMGENAEQLYSKGGFACKRGYPDCFVRNGFYDAAFGAFRSVAAALNDAFVPFFLCKSTLLGFARMCDLEPNDDDFALCVSAKALGADTDLLGAL